MLVKMVNSHWDLHKLLIVDVRQVLSDREATRLNRGTARRPAVRQQIMQQVYAERLLTAACEDLGSGEDRAHMKASAAGMVNI